MSDLPPLAIVMVTYKRTREALETVNSTCKNLIYPKELRRWYVGDDGSPKEHIDSILGALDANGEMMMGWHSERIRKPGQESTYFAGLGWNRALGIGHQYSEFVLWLEDDWRLETPLDIAPYIKVLMEHEEVGIVTFRILSVGADVHTVGYDGRHYLKYLRSTQYAYSGNPLLRHGRFARHYGWFDEERNPGDIELDLDSRFREKEGPEIIRPLDISVWGGWAHVGTEKTW